MTQSYDYIHGSRILDWVENTAPPGSMSYADGSGTGSWKPENDPTNPDAIPALKSSILDTFKTVWDCPDWITWHKAMKLKYGQEKANTTFNAAWNSQSVWINKNGCSANVAFHDYVRDNGIVGLSGIGNVIVGVEKTGTAIIDSAVNVADTAKSTSNTLKWLVPALLITAAIGITWYSYKNYIAT